MADQAAHRILVVNPGSTSTKVALSDGLTPLFETTLRHSSEILSRYDCIADQYDFRKEVIETALLDAGISIDSVSCVVGRGGLIRPVSGGTYVVSEAMLTDLRSGLLGEHASNLGGIIAYEIASERGLPAFVVDPVVVDELSEMARISGMPEIERVSIFHALNQKAVARRAAADMGGAYENMRFVVVHMGGGVTVGAHDKGRVVDVNDGLNGEGPFTPERTGGLPLLSLVKLCFSGAYTQEQIKKKVKGAGGLVAYLGTNDGREVVAMIEKGDERARLIYEAMAYQIAKEIGAMATVLRGRINAIILTGGLAHDAMLCGWIEERVSHIAPVRVYPGEDEMRALAEGALRVLDGRESARCYEAEE